MKIGDKVRIVATEEQLYKIYIYGETLKNFADSKQIYTISDMIKTERFNNITCSYLIKIKSHNYFFPDSYLEISNRKEKLERILNENR